MKQHKFQWRGNHPDRIIRRGRCGRRRLYRLKQTMISQGGVIRYDCFGNMIVSYRLDNVGVDWKAVKKMEAINASEPEPKWFAGMNVIPMRRERVRFNECIVGEDIVQCRNGAIMKLP